MFASPALAALPLLLSSLPDEVTAIRPPSSPLFTLLDKSPASIQRPSDFSELGLSLATAITETEDLIPRSYALEISPYWLKSRPELTFDEYVATDVPNVLRNLFYRNVVLSAALQAQQDGQSLVGLGVKTFAHVDADQAGVLEAKAKLEEVATFEAGRKLAESQLPRVQSEIAIKTLELEGKRSKRAEELLPQTPTVAMARCDLEVETIEAELAVAGAAARPAIEVRLARARNNLLEALKRLKRVRDLDEETKKLSERVERYAESANGYRETLAQTSDYEAKADEASRALSDAVENQPGGIVEIAAALTVLVDDKGGGHRVDRGGFWITGGWNWGMSEFLASARYIGFKRDGPDTHCFDLGGRFNLLFEHVTVFGELIQRWSSNDGVSHSRRAVGGVEYAITPSLQIVASFGQGFITPDVSNLQPAVATLALNFAGSGIDLLSPKPE